LKKTLLEALQRVIENPGKVGLARTAEIIVEIPLQFLIYLNYNIYNYLNDNNFLPASERHTNQQVFWPDGSELDLKCRTQCRGLVSKPPTSVSRQQSSALFFASSSAWGTMTQAQNYER
jgi:hypothetical protein